jgi:hypothetical protein
VDQLVPKAIKVTEAMLGLLALQAQLAQLVLGV